MTTIMENAPGPDAPAAVAAASLSEVSHRYAKGGKLVLDGIDLTVAPGELICLVGPSGSGKSTLLSLLAGLERPTIGTVEVGGRRPDLRAGGAALVFQEHALFPWLTAAGNIELALSLRGVPKAERRPQALDLLRKVDLDGSADARVHQLSGGMRQRVAIARALAQDAAVLLMDEPFAALDAITREALQEEVVMVHERTGTAIVFVTHNVREAVRLGQRVILLGANPGHIVAEWKIELPRHRRIDAPGVAAKAAEITDRLHAEMSQRAGSK